ncbi:MAG TPA: HAD-IIA family hydrolase [Actinomycetota bacterium]|nr:HAD-IIA family hydrolase [Actinomycetota bacterium]
MSEHALADRFDAFVVDLDGVVYLGERAVPRSPETIRELRARGKRLLFLTNDPRSSRARYAHRLAGIGVPADESEILTSGAATAQFLTERAGLRGAPVYVVGSPAFKAEMERAGLRLVDGHGDAPSAVVVGGHERFDYDELKTAALAVRAGAELYAAGRDATFPTPEGPLPATGAILAAIETAAGRRAQVVGKPEPFVFEIARARLEPAARVAVVGDNLDSDVAGGRRAGLTTILVLTGIATESEAASAPVAPDYVVDDLGALLEPL